MHGASLEHDHARERLQRAAGGDYEVGERIGRGGYADVFRATDRRLERTVALKVLRADLHPDAEAIERFRREARGLAALSHPHILPIHAIGGDAEVVFLVLAYVDGESLDARLERERVLPVDEATRLLRELAGALGAAHRAGIVHRDVKPANVLLKGTERRALLTDFGIARALGAEDLALTRTGTFVGTPHYLSPEQAAGDETDHRSDLYALGVLGYRMLAGALPFDGPAASVLVQHLTREPRPIRELNRDCPAWLADVVQRCLAKSPDERWETAEELRAALDAGASGDAVVDARPGAEAGSETTALEPDAAARRLRRTLNESVAMALAALVLDLVLTHTLTLSLLAVLALAARVAFLAGRLWTAGHDPRALLRGTPRAPAARGAEEFGRHAAAVRRARVARTRIIRQLADLSAAERGQVEPLVPAADAAVVRIAQCARRMLTLDERVGVARAKADGSGKGGGPTRVVGEMVASRTRLEAELRAAQRALDGLVEVAERASALDRTQVERELADALAHARHALRDAGRDDPVRAAPGVTAHPI